MKDKRMLYMATFAMGGIILIIVLVVVFVNLLGGRMSFEEVELKMESAAINYLESHEDELPKNNGSTITINAETLANAKKMKSLDKIIPSGSSCVGKVTVTNNGGKYLYSPILDCGEDYKSQKLYEVVTSSDKIVSAGEGLYAVDNKYVFKGENINNIVQIDEGLWAIIDVDAEGYMRLINVSNRRKGRSVWDDRYNLKEDDYSGINSFSVSRIKEYLDYLTESEEYMLEDSKVYVALRKWCIGQRSKDNFAINNDEECSLLSEEMMYGLPYVSDAFAASVDANCNDIEDESCNNYNYFISSSWTMTGVKESTFKAYYLAGSNYSLIKTSTTKNIVPTIYLSNNVMYASGDGSLDNPYTLK